MQTVADSAESGTLMFGSVMYFDAVCVLLLRLVFVYNTNSAFPRPSDHQQRLKNAVHFQ